VTFDDTDWTIYNNSNSGLRHNYVNCITIDKYGNKWIGTGLWETKGDLVKFDDTNWTIYNTTNSGMPQFSRVRCISIDQEDNKWIGTWPEEINIGVDQWIYPGGGLVKFDGTNWAIYDTLNSELSPDRIECISIDESGNKWVVTENGLVKFDGTDWTIYNTSNSGIPGFSRVTCITIDQEDNKWIGTTKGLINYDDASWTKKNTSKSGLPSNHISCIAIDDFGNKWFGTWRYGENDLLVKFDGSNWEKYDINNPGQIVCISIDESDNKWIGTRPKYNWATKSYEGGGLLKFDDTDWTVYDTSNSGLHNNRISCLAIDQYDKKWIGNAWGSLVTFDDTDWTVYDTSNSGLPNNIVSCIAIDESDNKFIGTYTYFGGGLVKLNSDNTSWTPIAGLPEGGITEIIIDAMGNKWIGVAIIGWDEEGKGLVKLGSDDATLTIFNESNSGLPGNYITSIAIDESGNKWVVTENGLVKFDGTDWTIYNESNSGIPSNHIYDIVVDESGNKWIGTFYGIAVFNEGGVVSIDENTTDLKYIPTEYMLFQNYPNPFNPSTTINYSIPKQSNVTIKVFDLLGSEVSTLVNKEQPQGNYEVEFTGGDLTSGIYFYRVQAGEFVETKKMILLK